MGQHIEDMDSTSATIGGLSARVSQVEERLAHLESGVSSILAILNQAKGGWRVILGLCAIVGGVFGMIEVLLKK